ncbi:hypothetical protein VDP41_20965 [Xanthomonas campestris pv. campestris]|nr:hypothetical protein [Xanthomonas campestris pv. campestris]
MTPTIVDALQRLAAALADRFQNEHLRYAAPDERAVVAELYVRVRERFPEYQVNDEYDRRERVVKDLIYLDAAGVMDEANILPDLIVHRVRTQDHNLLVVEAKRHTNRDFAKDIWKLRGMTDQAGRYAYAIGVHLVLNILVGCVVRADVYINGAIDVEETQWFAGQFE